MIVTVHKIAINYELKLKTQLTFKGIFVNHNVKLSRSLHFRICQMIYLLKDVYYILRDFYVRNWLLSYECDQIIRISQTQHYFCKFYCRYYWATLIPLHSSVHWQSENRAEVIWVHVSRFFIKVSQQQNVFKNIL